MRVVTRAEAQSGEPMPEADHFTGEATNFVFASVKTPATIVHLVRFATGVHNHWHRHSGGQLLHVVEGEGFVQLPGEEPRVIAVGDTAIIDPDEEHRHGARPDTTMAHLAVTSGDPSWR